MKNHLVKGLAVLLFFAGATLLMAQEAATPPPPTEGFSPVFGSSINLGTRVIDGETYTSVGFIPDLALGDFGVGLEVEINFQFSQYAGGDFGFYIRQEDWVVTDGTIQDWLDLYLSKIVYLRYGVKGSPLYAQFGLIPNGVLGNGFILGGFNNGILRPEKKYMGFSFDLDASLFGFPYVGLETFVGNITAWDVLGGRLFVRPLAWTSIPFLNTMQIGTTAVTDRNAFTHAVSTVEDPIPGNVDPVLVWGVDFRMPILNSPVWSLATFGDVVFQNNTWGAMMGFGGRFLGIFTYGAQARYLNNNFIPTYFDAMYDLNRTQKYQVLQGEGDLPAYVGWLANFGTSFLEDSIVFQFTAEGPLGAIGTSHPQALPKIRGVFTIAEGLLPVSLSAFYNKDNFRDFSSFIDPVDASIGARISYQTGPAVISLVYDLRYLPDNSPYLVNGQNLVITSRLETSISLF